MMQMQMRIQRIKSRVSDSTPQINEFDPEMWFNALMPTEKSNGKARI